MTESKSNKGLSGRYWKYAAIIMLLLGGGVLGWFMQREENVPVDVTQQIHPGISKARLVLADGKTVELEKRNGDTQLIDCDGMLISNDSCGLKYNGQIEMPVADWHTLEVSKGGEYIMTLQDGTVVWLNSETKMRYPVQFSGQNREVWLEGEAYFKVAKNEKQPFVVKTENMDVRVLGTEFNLKAYADEKWVQATLVRGEVAVFTGMDKSVRNTLKPEQQAEWDIEKGKLDVKTVELDLYIAWKNGQFVFRGQRLTEIMTVLERWYDFEVCYQADWIKEVEFAGKLNRSASIEPILDVIRSTHKINVNTRGKTIIFSAKQ